MGKKQRKSSVFKYASLFNLNIQRHIKLIVRGPESLVRTKISYSKPNPILPISLISISPQGPYFNPNMSHLYFSQDRWLGKVVLDTTPTDNMNFIKIKSKKLQMIPEQKTSIWDFTFLLRKPTMCQINSIYRKR